MDSSEGLGSSSESIIYDDRAVVASLSRESLPSFTAIAPGVFPNHYVLAGKDTLHFIRCDPAGIHELQTIKIAQFFQASTSSSNTGEPTRKLFGSSGHEIQAAQGAVNVSISITDVAWSSPQRELDLVNNTSMEDIEGKLASEPSTVSLNSNSRSGDYGSKPSYMTGSLYSSEAERLDDSLIAVACSNGVVVLWRAGTLLLLNSSNGVGAPGNSNSHGLNTPFHRSSVIQLQSRSSPLIAQPEAILVEHSRAVNRLVWHKRRPGLLITASQDSIVKLMERKPNHPSNSINAQEGNKLGGMSGWLENLASIVPSNKKMNTFMSFTWTCISTFTPRAEAIRDLQWSPFDDNIFAIVTDSGFLLVYDIMNNRPMVRIAAHAREATSLDWHPWRRNLLATGGSDRTVKIWDLDVALCAGKSEDVSDGRLAAETSVESAKVDDISLSSHSSHGFNHSMKRAQSMMRSSKLEKITRNTHVLSIAAPVTRIIWRPASGLSIEQFDALQGSYLEDAHEVMIAVATGPIHGHNSGGSGSIALWSYHRPFMPLCIMEGHMGSATDFVWIDAPLDEPITENKPYANNYEYAYGGLWQHVLSVGKDGRCLVQSLVKGMRPLSQVPKSTFALANLSPFQAGYGSLQIIAAHQPRIPSGFPNDLHLCALRQDDISSAALGIFRECHPINNTIDSKIRSSAGYVSGQKEPADMVALTFSVLDGGPLDEDLNLPLESYTKAEIRICPELIHVSRFAESYQLRRSSIFSTKYAICCHNAAVARNLKFDATARMWTVLASLYQLIESADTDGEIEYSPTSPMSVLFHSTVQDLLLERADAADVQTVVALCEVIGVLPVSTSSTETTALKSKLPGITVLMVREWYLSYIDILQQMCLFSYATDLIKNCQDSEIQKLNQQSTIIYESCPTCNKPLQGISALSETDRQGKKRTSIMTCQKVCTSCRQKVGFCFVCQERVESLFCWCPGCGHGGHLSCALEWYSGGNEGKALEEVCPSGCGHRCNLFQQSISFPRTDSLLADML